MQTFASILDMWVLEFCWILSEWRKVDQAHHNLPNYRHLLRHMEIEGIASTEDTMIYLSSQRSVLISIADFTYMTSITASPSGRAERVSRFDVL